jgi:hypothetical protein
VVFPDAGDWTVEFGLLALEVMETNPITISVGDSPADAAAGTATLSADTPECV